ncbi:MAG TPA: right-handed parallel beta-helix repeat-containing protein [Acidimicrobiia bacterium]|nr:right-handed parallel beta-helix repeat-containing protein [Acidimicrobiia bacterium]
MRVVSVLFIAFVAMGLPSFDPSNAAAVPSAPTAVTVVPGAGSATVSWKAPTTGAPILRYRINASRGAKIVKAVVTGTATSTIVTGLVSGWKYRFRVWAENANGAGIKANMTPAFLIPSLANGGTVAVQCTRTTTAASSLSAALTATAPGETLCLRGGVYRQGLTISRSGTAAAQIVVASTPGEVAIFDGSALVLGSTSSVVTISGRYVTLANVEVRNSTGRGVTLSGAFSRLSGTRVHDVQYNGVLAGGSAQTIDNNEVWNTVLSNANGRMGSSGWAEAVNTWRATDTTIRDNFIHDNWGEGIDFINSSGGTAHNNRVVDNFSVLIYVDGSSNISVVGNELATTTTKYYRSTAPSAVLVASEGGGNIANISVTGNRLSRTGGIRTWNVTPTNLVISGNVGT